jgi:hypothetical protein
MQEGREVFCKSFDWKLKESDARDAFSKFGTIENLHLPLNADGSHRGYFFVAYSSKVRESFPFVLYLRIVRSNGFYRKKQRPPSLWTSKPSEDVN